MSSDDYQPLEEIDFGPAIRGFHAGQRLLNRYVLKRVLGRGGMGVVWLVFDEALERDIAFKFLPEMVSHDRGALDDLKRETRRSLELTHPNIVRIYDFIHSEGCAGISMEYIDGDTLSNLRAEQPNKIFETADLTPWLKQLCVALEYAHVEAKLAHRDLKPANLMVSKRGVLKVADFGISRSVSDTMTRVNFHQGASGTLVYMSPQQALGERPSITDDIYSLGATIFELLASKPPFYQGEIMSQVREKTAPSIARRREELGIKGAPIPQAWEDTVAACLSKDPEKRPKSAREILVRLGLETAKAGEALERNQPDSINPATQPLTPLPGMIATASEPATPVPKTELARKGKLLVLTMIVLLLTGIATWYVISQASMAKLAAQTAARNQADKDREEIERKLREQKSAVDTQRKDEAAAKAAEDAKARAAGEANAKATAESVRKANDEQAIAEARAKLERAEAEAVRRQNLRGSVRVETEPPGATVLLAGQATQKSPAEFPDLRLDTYALTISRDGYESTNLPLVLGENPATRQGSNSVIHVALNRSMGTVWIDSVPPGAEFTLKNPDGSTLKSNQAIRGEKLPVGTYQVSAQYPGRKQPWTLTAEIRIEANQATRTNLVLPFGSAALGGVPAGVKIFRGAEEIGQTPLTLEELPPGQVEFTFRKKGFRPKTVAGLIRPQQVSQILYELPAIPGPERHDSWTNSLRMKFVPVSDGKLLFSVWETRVADYEAFTSSTTYNAGTAWLNPDFKQKTNSPAAYINWNDAREFCNWLTRKERDEGRLGKTQSYRLPTDKEWSLAVGLPDEPGRLPIDRDSKITGVYPWGNVWPPPASAGNYDTVISYDNFELTSPVGSFRPNAYGIFDLGGNLWEWCEDVYDATGKNRVLRGGSWAAGPPESLLSSYRRYLSPEERRPENGFRCVLEVGDAP